jgi:hypothetical protein
MGNLGLPMWYLGVSYDSTRLYGHSMNAMLVGNDLAKWDDWNFIEPQSDQTNVHVGQALMDSATTQLILYYVYKGKERGYTNEHEWQMIGTVLFRIDKGKVFYSETNPWIKDILITKRDTILPSVTITHSSNPKTLQWQITDETFRKAWYTIDDGPQVPIDSTGTVTLNLTDQIQKITVTAEDWFRLKTEVTTYRNATGIDGIDIAPPNSIYPNPFTDQITITNSS